MKKSDVVKKSSVVGDRRWWLFGGLFAFFLGVVTSPLASAMWVLGLLCVGVVFREGVVAWWRREVR